MIKQAAIYRNGIIYKGDRHRNIIASNKGMVDLSKGQQGFITHNGMFVNREEAAKIALSTGQIKRPKQSLNSEDIY